MIIFTPIRDIPVELLEYKGVRQVVKYNLSHYYAEMPTLNMLIPSIDSIPENILTGDCTDATFDQLYHNFIFTNDQAFIQFMNIIVPAFTNPECLVQIAITNNDYTDAITESLIKLIQQRYGYNAYIINDVEDFLYTEESDFSIPGLFIIDQDLSRFRLMSELPGEEYYE